MTFFCLKIELKFSFALIEANECSADQDEVRHVKFSASFWQDIPWHSKMCRISLKYFEEVKYKLWILTLRKFHYVSKVDNPQTVIVIDESVEGRLII